MGKFERITSTYAETKQRPPSEQTPIEEVSLPSAIEQELLRDVPRSALQTIKRIFTQAGVTEEQQQKFEEVVRDAYFQRPTTVSRRKTKGLGLDFRPQEYYFAPHISFDNLPISLTGLLPTNFTPKLGKEEHVTPSPLTETMLDVATELFVNPPPIKAPKNKDHVTTPIERMLAQINRLMYAFHEPLHIHQGLHAGDKINKIKDRFDATDLINPAKERAFVLQAEEQTEFHLKPVDGLVDSILPALPLGEPLDPDDASLEWTQRILSHNEATMDALSELALKETLREKPALLLWVHNTFCTLQAILRHLKDGVTTQEMHDKWGHVGIHLREKINHVIDLADFLEPLYFSAFENSKEALDTFTRPNLPKTLNRSLTGSVINNINFDRASYLNLVGDLKLLLRENAPKNYAYPSGETHPYDTFWNTPLTNKGIELTQQLIQQAHLLGKTEEDILTLTSAITHTMQKGMKPWGLVAGEDGPIYLSTLAKRVQNAWQLPWTEADLKELLGISKLLIPDFGGEYARQRFLRKSLMTNLLATHPEQIAPYIQSIFFEAPPFFNTEDFFMLTEFRSVKKEAGPRDTTRISMEDLTQEDLFQTTALSLFDLDVTKLSPDDQDLLWRMVEASQQSENERQQPFQESVIRWIIEKKRAQKIEAGEKRAA